jgi:apolipoprotein N-acyltransferase
MSGTAQMLELEAAATNAPEHTLHAKGAVGQRVRTQLLAGVTSAVLLWACFFPLACGWLAWVALVPLLCLVRSQARAWQIYSIAWLTGLLFFWAAIQWMRVADYRMYFTWAMLATYCSLYVPVTIWLVRRLDQRLRWPLVISLPLVWSGLEFVRSFLGTGFAWYFLAHSQHQWLPIIQVADLGGAYTVTFLIAAVNAWLFEVCYTQAWFRGFLGLPDHQVQRPRSLVLQGTCVLALFGATLAYGSLRLAEVNPTAGPRVAILQGNLDQRLRIQAAMKFGEAAQTMLHHYSELSLKALPARPALIIWPETSFPLDWMEDPNGTPLPPWDVILRALRGDTSWERDNQPAHEADARFTKYLLARVCPVPGPAVLLGVNAEVGNPEGKVQKRYCSALLVGPGAAAARYDKMHRVPFGEYVPLRDILPFMSNFAPYEFDYSITPGTRFTRFSVDGYHFGSLICFEDSDPYLARQYAVEGVDGPPVDFLVNISNDGWFDGSSEHDEHLAICRFRAVETRRAIARAVNMGISAIIDSNGQVLAPEKLPQGGELELWQINRPSDSGALPVSQWQRFKQVAGVLLATVPIDHRESLYARWGDWLGWGCVGIVAVGLGWTLLQQRLWARRNLRGATP